MTTPKSLAKMTSQNMKVRNQRLRTLYSSTILDDLKSVDVEETTALAIERLRQNPEHILEWVTPEELALFITLEEI